MCEGVVEGVVYVSVSQLSNVYMSEWLHRSSSIHLYFVQVFAWN